MRRPLIWLALVASTFGTIVACATSDGLPSSEHDMNADSGSTVLEDARVDSTADPVDAADDGFGEPPTCSPAGWCRTELPARGMSLADVWPVGSRAFAAGTSTSLGTKFLEWDGARGWTFIDKNMGFSNYTFVTGVWAPDEDEVFFVLEDLSGLLTASKIGALVVRGTRPTPPETTWSWTRSRIDCEDSTISKAQPALWGASRDEVYTAVCGGIYRLNRNVPAGDAGVDGGVATSDGWALEYADSDPDYPMWLAVAGTGTGDVWFNGVRTNGINQCAVLIRKTSEGYSTVVDGVPAEEQSVLVNGLPTGITCVPKAGIPMIAGQLSQVDAPAKDRLVGVHATVFSPELDNDMVHVAMVGGEAQIERASPVSTMDVALTSVWGTSPDDLWVLAGRNAGLTNGVLRATSVWTDAGAFEFSTLAINGAPNTNNLLRIRGTSNENLWAVGSDSAYFKSTHSTH